MRATERKNLKGRVSLSRWRGTDGQGWRLTVEDEPSSLVVIELELTDAQLGQILGSSSTETTVTYWDSPNIGKRMETAVILVDLDYQDFAPRGTEQAEVDSLACLRRRTCLERMKLLGYLPENGWEPSVPPEMNRHRRSDQGYQITLRRYVEPEGQP
jgi:hypothetical protein